MLPPCTVKYPNGYVKPRIRLFRRGTPAYDMCRHPRGEASEPSTCMGVNNIILGTLENVLVNVIRFKISQFQTCSQRLQNPNGYCSVSLLLIIQLYASSQLTNNWCCKYHNNVNIGIQKHTQHIKRLSHACSSVYSNEALGVFGTQLFIVRECLTKY